MEMLDLAFHLPCSTLPVTLGAVEALCPSLTSGKSQNFTVTTIVLQLVSHQSDWSLNPLRRWQTAGLRPLKQLPAQS